MENYHVVADDAGWRLHAQGSDRKLLGAKTKAELLDQLPGYMEGRVGSVKIHTENGQIEEERTYPRSEDPSQSKG